MYYKMFPSNEKLLNLCFINLLVLHFSISRQNTKKLYIGLYFEVWIQTQDLQKRSPCKYIFAKNINKMFITIHVSFPFHYDWIKDLIK